ncbi:hypothetical protein MHU86_8147 [Fragilaria crotonensis]|nr:hypothetical protein MHU86_8147 [Fragilaria crotonensis]
MVTAPLEQAEYPRPLDAKWKESVVSMAADVLSNIRTRSTASLDSLFSAMSFKDKLQVSTNEASSTSPITETTITTTHAASLISSHHCHDPQAEQLQEGLYDETLALQNQKTAGAFCFWSSREAWNLFAGGSGTSYEQFSANITNAGGGSSVLDILEGHIVVLQSVSKTPNGWRNVVPGRDEENVCSQSEIFVVRSRSIILCLAYQTATRHMNSWTWAQCCSEACRQLNELGVVQATKPRSVQDWNVEFRRCTSFLHPNHIVRCGRRPIPRLFMKYPDAKDQITAFGLGNLTVLTVELVQAFCIEELFPQTVRPVVQRC